MFPNENLIFSEWRGKYIYDIMKVDSKIHKNGGIFMLKSLKFLVVTVILFMGFGSNSIYASDNQNVASKSTDDLWDEVEKLSNETNMFYKDTEDEVNTNSVVYQKWGKSTMNLSFTETYAVDEVETLAYPVSRVTATGKTIRDHAVGTSALVTVLMRNGRELSRNSDSSTLSKTATAKVNTYPGSVPSNTEFRAHGTHTITKGLKQSLGYTGDSLNFK